MATIADALRSSILETVPVPEWEQRLPIRPLYASPDFLDKIEEDAVLFDLKHAQGGRTLYEHLWQRLSEFRCARRPGSGDIHPVMPNHKGIWKMHSNGLRLFGWAPATHALALVEYALADETHSVKGLVARKREAVLAFIKTHGLTQTMMKGGYLEIFPHE